MDSSDAVRTAPGAREISHRPSLRFGKSNPLNNFFFLLFARLMLFISTLVVMPMNVLSPED
jgi:hypothetical protein